MRRLALSCAFAYALAGCGQNQPPVIDPIGDQTAVVGVELAFDVRATDPEGDPLKFDFDAPGLADIKTRANPATLVTYADGVAKFRWVPSVADLSDTPWAFDFQVTDGSNVTTETIQVLVTGGTTQSPVFRKPLGTGTTLDLSTQTCVTVAIEVADPDSTMVTLSQGDATLPAVQQTDAFSGTWMWCPSAAQIAAQDRYLVTFVADDGVSPPAQKPYLIVLRRVTTGCPGNPPVITSTPPGPQSTVLDITITANITDDVGLKGLPFFYWTLTVPTDPPDLSTMTQGTMTLSSGTTYTATLPNPVASSPAGSSATIYYFISAQDNDDPTGVCDHYTTAPPTGSGSFSVMVTNPGTSGGGAICAACTSDAQCGGSADNCINIGTGASAGNFCSIACGGGLPACPTGYNCSASAVLSVDGVSSRQCQPKVGYCGPPPPMTCTDDSYEENDSRTTIANSKSSSFTPGTVTSLALCNRDDGSCDEDWYGISVPTTGGSYTIDAKATFLVGTGYSDLDLQMVDTAGNVVDGSYGITDTEEVVICAPTKRYLRVFTFDTPPVNPNLYDLTVSVQLDDAQEPNDSAAAAASISPSTGTPLVLDNLRICPSNADWFATTLFTTDVFNADATFASTVSADTLTLQLYNSTPTLVATGTLDSTGAHISGYTPAADDIYYVVVKGKTTTSQNTYSLTVNLQ
jgi:hypothetical protein